MSNLAKFIREVRLHQGLTLSDVADRSKSPDVPGLSRSYISMIESGKVTNISANAIKALAKALNVREQEVAYAAMEMDATEPDVVDERIARIGFNYRGIPDKKRVRVEALIELLDREIARIKAEEGPEE